MTTQSPSSPGAAQLGSSFANYDNPAGTVHTALAPGSNTKGAIVRFAHVCLSSTASRVAWYADTAAPTGSTDTTKRKILETASTSSSAHLPFPLLLPAGVGLYFAADVAASGVGGIGWDLL